MASVMLCAISSLSLVSPLGAWSFRPVFYRQSSFAFTFRLVNHHLPTISMADQLNALPDTPAPAGAQQVAEPAQNLPQELEPIAEPAAPMEVTLFLFLLRSMYGLVLLRLWVFSA